MEKTVPSVEPRAMYCSRCACRACCGSDPVAAGCICTFTTKSCSVNHCTATHHDLTHAAAPGKALHGLNEVRCQVSGYAPKSKEAGGQSRESMVGGGAWGALLPDLVLACCSQA